MMKSCAAAAAALLLCGSALAQQALVGPRHAAAVLPDRALGVLVVGGDGADGFPTTDASIYAPDGTVTTISPLSTPRSEHTATLLYDGRILVVGGTNGVVPLASLEILDLWPGEPVTAAFRTSAATLIVPRRGHEALGLDDGRVLIRGGVGTDGQSIEYEEVYDPRTDTIAQAEPGLAFASIGTDYLDYLPGQTVRVWGGGWRPGENVDLLFDREPFETPPVVITVMADAHGELNDVATYVLEPDDYLTQFTLHAVGATSAMSADAYFTDANGALAIVSAISFPTSVSLGQTVGVTVTVRNQTNAGIDGIVVSLAVPSGWTAPQATTISSLAKNAEASVVFTVTAATAGTFTLTASTDSSDRGCSTGADCTAELSTAGITVIESQFLLTSSVTPPEAGSLSCTGGPCIGTLDHGTQVTFSRPTATGYDFGGWMVSPASAIVSGCGAGGATCTVVVNAATDVNARFDAQQFQLTSSVTPAESGSFTCTGGPCAGTLSYGTQVTFSANANAGFALAGWAVAPMAAVVSGCGAADEGCEVVVNEATDVQATYARLEYALTVEAPLHGTIACGNEGNEICPATVSHGDELKLTATAVDGYHFLEWTGDCAGQAGTTCTLDVLDAIDVGASFTADLKTLTVVEPEHGSIRCLDDGDTLQQCPGQVAFGTALRLTAQADDGYSFGAWTGACDGQGASCAFEVAGDSIVGATFTPNPEQLLLTVGSGGSVKCQVGTEPPAQVEACLETYPHGTTVTLFASENTGYTFSGWSGACGGILECTVVMNGQKEIQAGFSIISQSLGITIEGPGAVKCDGEACAASYGYGTNLTLTAHAGDGATFDGWGGDKCSGAGECEVLLTEAIAVSAKFTPILRALTVTAEGGDVVCMSENVEVACSPEYGHGSWVHLVARPAPGNGFTGWKNVCEGISAPTCDFQITSDTAVVAEFASTPQTLTMGTVIGNGVITCNSEPCRPTYPKGSRVVYEAVAAPGYLFGGWAEVCAGEGSARCERTLDADAAIGATFTLNPASPIKSIKVTPPASGRVSAKFKNGGTTPVDCGAGATSAVVCNLNVAATTPATVLTFEAAPQPGAKFIVWNPPCTGTNPKCDLAMIGSATVSALFQPDQWKLNASIGSYAGPSAGSIVGTLKSDGTEVIRCSSTSSTAPGCNAMIPNNGLNPAEVVTLVATPNEASKFRGWAGSCSGTNPTCTVTVNMAKSVVATFTPASFSLTAQLSGAGKGTVTAAGLGGDPGITCTTGSTANCSMIVPNAFPSAANEVELTATPKDETFWFAGWSGCTSTGPLTCKVSVAASAWVSAKFLPKSYLVTVNLSGTGRGGIAGGTCTTDWPRTCTVAVPTVATGQAKVTLMASPESGYALGSWGWPCSGSTAESCTFVVGVNTTTSATFK